jgi:hypothetical protein
VDRPQPEWSRLRLHFLKGACNLFRKLENCLVNNDKSVMIARIYEENILLLWGLGVAAPDHCVRIVGLFRR